METESQKVPRQLAHEPPNSRRKRSERVKKETSVKYDCVASTSLIFCVFSSILFHTSICLASCLSL